MAKKNNKSFLIGILVAIVSVALVGGISKLANDNNWFDKESEEVSENPSSEEKVLKSVFAGGVMDYSVSSMSAINMSNCSFCYDDLTLFENSKIQKIRLPIKTIADYTVDSVFTYYVIDSATAETATNPISTHELIIPANTYSTNSINSWVDFEVDLDIKSGQTLAFCKADDSIIVGYTASQTSFGATIFNKVLSSDSSKHYGTSVRMFIDVYSIKN